MSTPAGPPRDVVGYGGRPPAVTWPGGARIAISLVINVEEGSEPSVPDGDPRSERSLTELPGYPWPPGYRDLAAESTYEYGSRAGFWRLASILDEHDVRATYFVCAVALERNEHIARHLRERNADFVAHGYRWEDVTSLGREGERDHLYRAVTSLEATLGRRPVGWYCRYGPSVHTRELLVEEGGFRFDCDAYNDDLPYWTTVDGRRHLVIPYDIVNNDRNWGPGPFGPPRDFEEHLRYDFDRLYAEGASAPKMMSVGLHSRVAGQPARAQAVTRFIRHAKAHPGVWFATRGEIADHWYENHA
jgi:allantoinase